MSRLSRQQKDMIQQFKGITDANEKTALATLKASDWNLELAFEIFYSGGAAELAQYASPARTSADPSRMDALFQRYKDPHQDLILADGIGRLCEDLQVDASDIVMLLLSHRMQAATMGEYSRQEFVTGLRSLGVDSVEGLRNALPALRSELSDEGKFRDVYVYAFAWSREKGQKSLALDTALAMWRLIFSHKRWPHTDYWCHFLETKHNKAISRDTWNQLWDFTKITDSTFSNYDDTGAWPYLIDEFVEHLQEQGLIPKRQSVTKG